MLCCGSSPVLVAFIYKPPIYKCTPTENEFIVYYGIWCILSTKIFLWPYLTLVFMDGSVFMCTKNPRTSFFLGGGDFDLFYLLYLILNYIIVKQIIIFLLLFTVFLFLLFLLFYFTFTVLLYFYCFFLLF